MAERIATIDIGTNTLLLLIAEVGDDGAVTAVHEDCRFGRLGKNLDASGNLDPGAVARSLDIVRTYRAAMAEHEVDRVHAVGTQSLREAGNRAEFVGPAEATLGTEIEIISGDREADLVDLASARSFPDLARGTIVVADVGGGSTETIVGSAGQVTFRKSTPIGSVRLAERHLQNDPPSASDATNLIEAATAALAPLDLPTGAPLIATAGTATTLATVELKLPEYDGDRVQGLRLDQAVVERQLARYLELTVDERKKMPGLEPQRADVIPAGTAIFLCLMRKLGAQEIIVSDRGVRWGVAFEMIG